MNMILGYVMTFLGFSGTFYFWSYIKHDYWYTYTAPFTSHETTVLTKLVFSIYALIAGIGGLCISYYLGTSTGAAISLILALCFTVTFCFRKVGA